MRRGLLFFLCALFAASALASEPIGGWRGNGTGIWKTGNPPLTWQRLPRGACDGLRAQTNAPAIDKEGDAALVEKGQIREWLILGPFAVQDAIREFDHDPLGGEATVKPTLGVTS